MQIVQALARKWRPKDFDSVVGQRHIIKVIENSLIQGRVHHAYLLTGTRGVGKTTIARIIAKAVNCTELDESGLPTLGCRVSKSIDSGSCMDILEIDAASNTGIDSIRELIEMARYQPTELRFKIYIIDEVHMLSRAAFNALLKILEEPPPHVKFILATTDPQKVPVTVLSRCLQFALRNLSEVEIADRMRFILDKEGIGFEEGAVELLSAKANGSMRDGLSLLDQAIAYGQGELKTSVVTQMMGLVDEEIIQDILLSIKNSDASKLLDLGRHALINGSQVVSLIDQLILEIHKLSLKQLLGSEDGFSSLDLQLFMQILVRSKAELPLFPSESMALDMILLRLVAFKPVDNFLSVRAEKKNSIDPSN